MTAGAAKRRRLEASPRRGCCTGPRGHGDQGRSPEGQARARRQEAAALDPISPSCRRRSSGARTTGPTSRASACWSTSGPSSTGRRTRSPASTKKLLKALPGVGEHSCSLGKKGGFKERLEDGTWMGHVAEHVALELQRETGAHISRGKTRSAGPPGQYNVIYGYAEETVGLAAGALAVRLLNHLVKAEDGFDFEAEREAVDPARRTPAVRPVDAGDHRRSRHPRHPVDPAERALPGPAWPGDLPAADPRHDDLARRVRSPWTSPATRR